MHAPNIWQLSLEMRHEVVEGKKPSLSLLEQQMETTEKMKWVVLLKYALQIGSSRGGAGGSYFRLRHARQLFDMIYDFWNDIPEGK